MKFTHRLTFAEQDLLTEDQSLAYFDWLLSYNESICRAREARDEKLAALVERGEFDHQQLNMMD